MQNPITRGWLKEPLLHFLLAGGLIFLLIAAWEGQPSEGRNIRLNREDLLTFLQGRAQVYDKETFDALLDRMNAADRAALIRDAAIQEALYREGIALGLAQADPLIRQRVVQQMRLLLMEEAAADMQLSDAEMRVYFDSNRAKYALPSAATFTHVFAAVRGQATALLEQLRRDQISGQQANAFGERFLYQSHYSDVGPAMVRGHFGESFADALFAMPEGRWQGPVQSDRGWHLVLLEARSAARAPSLTDVAATVREDALAAKRQAAATEALNRLLDRYEISSP